MQNFKRFPRSQGACGPTMPTRKKFSTALPVPPTGARAGLGLSILGLCALLQGPALAQTAARAAGTPTERIAPTTPARGGDVFVANAPDRHTVVKGDTLWDIAGKYLKQPWRWPQIWNLNREQIKNPHWIYPGQVIYLNKTDGTMSLTPPSGEPAVPEVVVTLKPGVRVEQTDNAIPAIPPEAIEPFLSQPLLIDPPTALAAPRVIGAVERVLLGPGDIIYASGVKDLNVTDYLLYRPGRELKDPETGATLGHEAVYLGAARVTRRADPLTLQILNAEREIVAGDRMVPAGNRVANNYVPHAPEQDIRGSIVALYNGVAKAGKYQIVALNRGTANGVEIGHVFAMQNLGRTIVDRTNGEAQSIKLPDERNGLIFVFRVFDKVSYALIMNVTNPVTVGDRFIRP